MDESPDTHEPVSLRPPPTPRWVKALAAIVIVAFLIGILVVVSGVGGPHGPFQHAPVAS